MTNTPAIEHFRTRLLEERRALKDTRQARDDATATVQLDQSSVGRLSRMDALQQQAMAKNVSGRADLALQQIGRPASLRRWQLWLLQGL
jgi:DnaK suppressor protein